MVVLLDDIVYEFTINICAFVFMHLSHVYGSTFITN